MAKFKHVYQRRSPFHIRKLELHLASPTATTSDLKHAHFAACAIPARVREHTRCRLVQPHLAHHQSPPKRSRVPSSHNVFRNPYITTQLPSTAVVSHLACAAADSVTPIHTITPHMGQVQASEQFICGWRTCTHLPFHRTKQWRWAHSSSFSAAGRLSIALEFRIRPQRVVSQLPHPANTITR